MTEEMIDGMEAGRELDLFTNSGIIRRIKSVFG